MTRPKPRSAALMLTLVLAVSVPAVADEPVDVSSLFAGVAGGERIRAVELAGVLILRGRVYDRAVAEAFGIHARALGFSRVANLIQTADHDDQQLVRTAERELATHRSLDGCRFRVVSERGIVRVAGTVRHELQKDVALQVLRSIDGVRAVQVSFQRF